MGDLHPPELQDGRDVGVNRALGKQGPFRGRGGRPCRLRDELEGRRRDVAVAVVREQRNGVRQGHLQGLGERLDLREGGGVGLLSLQLPVDGSRADPRLASRGGLDAPQQDVLLEPRRQLVGRDELAVWPGVSRAVLRQARRRAPRLHGLR
jgi:hypothetical protein